MRRRGVLALVLVTIAVIAGGVVYATRDDTSSNNGSATSTTRDSTTDSTIPADPAARQGTTVAPDPHATAVRAAGANDETSAFEAAMDDALHSAYRRPGGPDGDPQAVVYVPPGVHRILRVAFRDNIRLEVDAGAVLQQAGGRNAKGGNSKYLIVWDGASAQRPLRNVSIVGVGQHDGGVKQQAEPVEAGWSIANAFTMDLDPRATDADDKVSGIELLNVDGFLVENLFSIQNADESTPTWPTSAKAVLVLRPRDDSPVEAPFAQPRNGAIVHHYNVNSPRGYGPNQVGGATSVRFSGVYSRGGTALRLESDATKNKTFGGEIRDLTADTIVGVDCNRAVSFAPHAQRNTGVHVSGVLARGCSQGVIESDDEKLGAAKRGGFFDSTISDVTVVAGPQAQNPAKQGGGSKGAWVAGPSQQAFARDESAQWSVAYTRVRCTGAFTRTSDRLMLDGSMRGPMCES
ncbi:MAG TPA: hypothetical protein VHC63_11235 [Acidimicrobiales bacterium]|nr:hypothetical protein [Acidimicrobiales bacterium]